MSQDPPGRYFQSEPEQDPNFARDLARDRLRWPGVFLLIVGLINVVIAIRSIQVGIIFLQRQMSPQELEQAKKDFEERVADLNRQRQAQGQPPISFEEAMDFMGELMLKGGYVVLGGGMVVVVGGLAMLLMWGYVMAVIGSIVALIPLISPSCCLIFGLPVGIWCLVVLFSDTVRAGWR
jgi:hypothetical protein